MSVCHVNISAIVNNYKRLRELSPLMPVLKSDAYGHGLLSVAGVLPGPFAVGSLGEALELRSHGVTDEIVALLPLLEPAEYACAVENGITVLAGSLRALELAGAAGLAAGRRARVALKFDTGMGRLGFAVEEAETVAKRLKTLPIAPGYLVSHLARAESWQTSGQVKNFMRVCDILKTPLPSLANSAGLWTAPLPVKQVARVGLALYGGNPFYPEKPPLELSPAMSLVGRLISIRTLKPGETVSYGCTWTAKKPTRVGIVDAGYANGIPRSLSGRLKVKIRGKWRDQLGAICMNMLAVEADGCETGDSVAILGGGAMSLDQAADLAGTIPYELMCNVGRLNRREVS